MPYADPEKARLSQNERARRYYAAHREEILAKQRQVRLDAVAGEELRARERERIAAMPEEGRQRRREMNRDWYRRNPRSPEKNAEMHYRFRFAMTPEQRAKMIEDQQGLCYLCAEPLPDDPRKVHTDHDHSCCRGKRSCGTCVRGIACDPCNRGVGYFADDPDRMRRVADNLEMANRRLRSTAPGLAINPLPGGEAAAVTPRGDEGR